MMVLRFTTNAISSFLHTPVSSRTHPICHPERSEGSFLLPKDPSPRSGWDGRFARDDRTTVTPLCRLIEPRRLLPRLCLVRGDLGLAGQGQRHLVQPLEQRFAADAVDLERDLAAA